MEFSIKYTTKDYSKVFKYSVREEIKYLGKNPDNLYYKSLFAIITPLVCLYHKLGKLKHTYHFYMDEDSITRSHDTHSGTVDWTRFLSYLHHPNFFKLDFDQGSLIIPKRVLKPEWITRLENILQTNNIEQKPLISLPSNT